MPRPKEKENRNRFTIDLLRKLIKREAMMVFPDSKNCLANYLSIPREDQNTIGEIRCYQHPKGSNILKIENIADSTASWVYDRKSDYHISIRMLNRVVKRLTFFGKFDDYYDFEEHYKKWSSEFDSYIENDESKIPEKVRLSITRMVYKIYSAEEVYLEQKKSIQYSKYFGKEIRLTKKYLLVLIEGRVLDIHVKVSYEIKNLLEVVNPIDDFPSNEIMDDPIVAILDAHCNIVAKINIHSTTFFVANKVNGRLNKSIFLKKQLAMPSDNIYLLKSIKATDIQLYCTLLYFLGDALINYHNYNPENKIVVIANKQKFMSFGLISGFKILSNKRIVENSDVKKNTTDDYIEIIVDNGQEVFYLANKELDEIQIVNLSGLEKY